jgi:hypothetical protein
MDGLSSILHKLTPRKFTGSSDQDVQDFTEGWKRDAVIKAATSVGAGRHPLSAAELNSVVGHDIPKVSPAYAAFQEIRKATNDYVVEAEHGRFLHHDPSPDVIAAALGVNSSSPAHVSMLKHELQEQFGDLMQNADAAGLMSVTAALMRTSRPSARAAQVGVNNEKGETLTPYLYAHFYTLAILEVRFGEATLQQENELKRLTQGQLSLDTFVVEIRRRAEKLKHRAEFDEGYLTILFTEGLNNKDCSQQMFQTLAGYPQGSLTLANALELATTWERAQQRRLQVRTEQHVARSMDEAQKGTKGPTLRLPPLAGQASDAPAKPSFAQLKRQYMQATQDKYGHDHPDAPCKLLNHRGHSNRECNQQQQRQAMPPPAPPAPQSYMQPAAVAHYQMSQQDARYNLPDQYSSSSGSIYAPAAAVLPMGKQVSWADQQRAAATRYPQPQQQQSFPRPPGLQQYAANKACGVCGWHGGHGRGACYYDRPDQAPPDWRPSYKGHHALLEHYRKQCARYGVPAKEPHPPAATQPPGIVKPAGAFTTWEEHGEIQPAAEPVYHAPQGEPESWFPMCTLADSDPAAALTRAGKQPHSFMPADNTQPRAKRTGSDKAASAYTPVPLQFSLTGQINPELLPQLMALLGQSNSAAEAACSLSLVSPRPNAGACSASCGAQLPVSTSSSNSSNASGQHPVAMAQAHSAMGSSLAGLQQQSTVRDYVLQQVADLFPDSKLNPEEASAVLARHSALTEQQHLNIFSSSDPKLGVSMLWGPHGAQNRRQPPKAASDSGCVPSIMVESLIKATGVKVRDLTPEERNSVRAIDGTVSSRIYGRTEPITIVLAEGTDQEASLTSDRGFLAVRGAEAAHMYDMVIGRDLLDRVSGFVIPVLGQFCYMPRLEKGDFKIATLPVIGGRPVAAHRQLIEAATLADALTYTPIGALLQEDAPMQATEPPQPQQQQQQQGESAVPAEAAASLGTTEAASQTEPPGSQPKQQSSLWRVISKAALSTLLVVIWPLLWVFSQVDNVVTTVWDKVFSAAVKPVPTKGTTYWRLGRGHRSAAGETIYLRTSAQSSGRKPRSIDIQHKTLTWKYIASNWSAKLLILALLITAFCVTGTSAMHTYQGMTADSSSMSARQTLMAPMPYSAAHLLAAGLTDHLGDANGSKCFRG